MRRRIVVFLFVLVIAGWCGAAVVDDFEPYADTLALKAKWTNTANLTISLVTTSGADANVHSGLQAMKYSYNGGASPYYSKSERILDGAVWGVSGVDWSTYTSLSLWYKVTKSKDTPYVELYDCWGTKIYGLNLASGLSTVWKEAVITFIPGDPNLTRVGRLDLGTKAVNYGTGVVYYDDITLIPEPATIALLGLGSLALIRRRRRF